MTRGMLGLGLTVVSLGLPVLLFFLPWVSLSIDRQGNDIAVIRLTGANMMFGVEFGDVTTDAGKQILADAVLKRRFRRQSLLRLAFWTTLGAIGLVCYTVHLTGVHRAGTAVHPALLQHGDRIAFWVSCGINAILLLLFLQRKRVFRAWTAEGFDHSFTLWYWLQLVSVALLWSYWSSGVRAWKAGRVQGYDVPADWRSP